jgi:hypothetical protein
MLPILRAISVGGVLLAITILALALSPPGGSHIQFTAVNMPAHGALIDAAKHPEWRQFLILAALRRADEINRLRELPDTPTRLPEIPNVAPEHFPPEFPQATTDGSAKGSIQTAGLPVVRDDVDPDDETGSINVAPGTTIPIEIGEPSATELPVTPVEERPPVQRLPLTEAPALNEPPEPAKAPTVTPADRIETAAKSHRKTVQHRRIRTPAPEKKSEKITAPIPFNLLQALFESLLQRSPDSADNPPHKTRAARKRQAKSKPTASFRSASQ